MEWEHTVQSETDLYRLTEVDGIVTLESKKSIGRLHLGSVKRKGFSYRRNGAVHEFAAQRVRFRADIATENTYGAGLFLHATEDRYYVSDAMYDRLVVGTTDWQTIALVINVPPAPVYLSYGLWMTGGGKCTMKCMEFSIVDLEIPVTNDDKWIKTGHQRWEKEERA